jgi:hypothetical protein
LPTHRLVQEQKKTKYPTKKEEEEEVALASALVQKFLMAIIINKAKRNVKPFHAHSICTLV